MRILYPLNPLNIREADGDYQQEYEMLISCGVDCSLFDFDSMAFDEFSPKPSIVAGETILYRGWMLNPESYKKMNDFIQNHGGTLFTSPEDYEKSHHLDGWYELCKGLTAETICLAYDENLKTNIESINWDQYFIKDYVKSNSTERGSIANSPDEAIEIVKLICMFRGEIEGGIAVRRVEQYQDETEVRYFVFNGKAYSPTSLIPSIVNKVIKRVKAPFYSIDVILNEINEDRIVEIGDGQVSDRKDWPIHNFVQMLFNESRKN
jgi:hypothetical protein